MINVGCCGFPVGRKKYFKTFKVVEIQKTFYTFPDKKILKKWREEAPSDFEFTVKVNQLITHPPSSPTYKKLGFEIKKKQNYGFFKPTKEVFEAFERILEISDILKAKILLFQTPSSFKPTLENKNNIKEFFNYAKKIASDKIFVWEPRGEWENDDIKELVENLGIIHCVDPFKNKNVPSFINYYRLHGLGKGYRWVYSEEELKNLLNFIDKNKNNYFMFNNTNMFEDAQKLLKILKDEGILKKIF